MDEYRNSLANLRAYCGLKLMMEGSCVSGEDAAADGLAAFEDMGSFSKSKDSVST